MNKQQQKKLLTEIMNEDAKDVLYDNKAFTIGKVREIMDSWEQGEISYGRMVEMLNDIAIKWHENHIGGSNKMVEHHIVDTNKMITAVEWLELVYHSQQGYISKKDIEQAKAMEKEQIIKTWYDCKMSIIDNNPIDAEEYYKETYKNEKDN
jgi:hypothetical protein